MSAREWKPGDVAMLGDQIVLRVAYNLSDHAFVDSAGLHWRNEDDHARPLVVIDPEDREQVERLYDLFWQVGADPNGKPRPARALRGRDGVTPADGFIFAAPTLAEAFPRHRRAVLLPSADVDPETQAECSPYCWPCPRHEAPDFALNGARHRSDR